MSTQLKISSNIFNFILVGSPQPSPNPSDPTQSISNEELRDHYFGEIVREEIEFEVLAEEFNYFNGEYFFEEMDEYSDWLSLGTWEDTIYQNFYNYLLNSNIGEFSEVIDLMENGNIDEAINQNIGIIPGNAIEANEQFVNEMYLSYYLNDTIPPSNELQALENIALLTPWIGGEAVYTARILLGIDPDLHGIAYRLQKEDSTFITSSKVNIYPNPTASNVTIEFEQLPESFVIVQMDDLTGKELINKRLESSLRINFELNHLKSGTYLLKVSDVNGLIETKLLIIK